METKKIQATKNIMHLGLEVMIAKECVRNLFQSVVNQTILFFDSHLLSTRLIPMNPFLMVNRNYLYFLNFLFWRLTYHHEHYRQAWCEVLQESLLNVKKEMDDAKAAEMTEFPAEKALELQKAYNALLQHGIAEIPALRSKTSKKRGRKKQHLTKNLWDRLFHYPSEVLAFTHDFNTPFTNNQAEQDIRMSKVKRKISECFRSKLGAAMFCWMRRVIFQQRESKD